MSQIFLIKNQHHAFLDKSGSWATGLNVKSLYRTAHKDEGINQKVEFAVKSPDLRLSLIETSLSEKGNPIIPEEFVSDDVLCALRDRLAPPSESENTESMELTESTQTQTDLAEALVNNASSNTTTDSTV